MKYLYYLLIAMLAAALIVNSYSLFYDKHFFWSSTSKGVNISTPVVAFIYLLLYYLKEKKKLNKQFTRYAKYFSKN